MGGLVLLVLLGYLAIAALELPGLWGRKERRGELWTVSSLLLISLGFSLLITLGYRPISVWQVIEAIFSPIGTPLFKPPGGG